MNKRKKVRLYEGERDKVYREFIVIMWVICLVFYNINLIGVRCIIIVKDEVKICFIY